jgi:hypothetical protein
MEAMRFPSPSGGLRALVCLAFRLLPTRHRFRAAVVFSHLMRPLITRTAAFEARLELQTDRIEETSLDLILTELTRRGVTFDPLIEIDGVEHDPRPGDGPCLIAGAHMMLNTLYARHLFDRGVPFGGITAEPDMCYRGTRVISDVILVPSRDLLLNVRRRLLQGGVVCGLLDRDIAERRTTEFETVNGKLIVSQALLQVALRVGARIVFFGSRMRDDHTVVISLRRAEASTLDGVTAELVCFVDQVMSGATPRTSHPANAAAKRPRT